MAKAGRRLAVAALVASARAFRLPVPRGGVNSPLRVVTGAGSESARVRLPSISGEATSTSLASSYTTVPREVAAIDLRRRSDRASSGSSGPSSPRRRHKYHTQDVAALTRRVREAVLHLGVDDEHLLQRALAFAVEAHVNAKGLRDGVARAAEAVDVFSILARLELDTDALLAALLSGVLSPEAGPLGFGRAPTAASDVEQLFGARVALLVQSSERLAGLELDARRLIAVHRKGATEARRIAQEQLCNLVLTEAADWRVVVLRVATHARRLRWERSLPRGERAGAAREALHVHAPLARKLGMHALRNELEGAAFEALYPLQHAACRAQLQEQMPEHDALLQHTAAELAAALEANAGFMSEVENVRLAGRIKEPYSMWRKMLRGRAAAAAAAKTGMPAAAAAAASGIFDAVALRVVFKARRLQGETEAARDARSARLCHEAADVVRQRWETMEQRTKDYVAAPKENGYRSLHVTALEREQPFEVQVRSFEMHQQAEFGVAAHWSYKGEGSTAHTVLGTSPAVAPARQQQGAAATVAAVAAAHVAEPAAAFYEAIADGRDFVNWYHSELQQRKVFVFGPDGLIWDLDKSATAADVVARVSIARFYAGARGRGATATRVNGRDVPLHYQLSNGDVVSMCT